MTVKNSTFQLLTAVVVTCGNFLLVASEDESKHKPTIAMSALFLAIPIIVGLTAVSLLTRKLYLACAKKLEQDEDVPMHVAEEFSTSLDTTDSFEEIKLDSRDEHITVPWNPFQKKYVNVETKNDADPLEEMEARFVERKMIKILPMTTPPPTHPVDVLWSPKPPLHDFSRLGQGTNIESLHAIRNNMGVSIRV